MTGFIENLRDNLSKNFILRHSQSLGINRRRPMKPEKQALNAKPKAPRLRTTRYFVRNSKNEKVPVCMESFKNILNLSRFRMNLLTMKDFMNDEINEKRGGFKRQATLELKRQCVMNFINSLTCLESHYCREKSMRKYVSAELNIKKLWRMYSLKPNNLPVKQSFFSLHFQQKI